MTPCCCYQFGKFHFIQWTVFISLICMAVSFYNTRAYHMLNICVNPSHHALDRMCLWSNFYCKCTTLLVLFSSSWTALQLSPALVPASFKYGRSWLLDCPQLAWQPAQRCFLSLPYHPSPAAEPEITPLPQHGIFVHKSDMHEQWSSNALHLWCHNIFCFFKVANKKQKITLIAVLIFIVVSLFIWIASLPSLFLARYFSVTLSDGGRHTAWFLMKNNVTLSGQFEFCYKTPFQIATTHSQDSVHYQIQFTRGILCCY